MRLILLGISVLGLFPSTSVHNSLTWNNAFPVCAHARQPDQIRPIPSTLQRPLLDHAGFLTKTGSELSLHSVAQSAECTHPGASGANCWLECDLWQGENCASPVCYIDSWLKRRKFYQQCRLTHADRLYRELKSESKKIAKHLQNVHKTRYQTTQLSAVQYDIKLHETNLTLTVVLIERGTVFFSCLVIISHCFLVFLSSMILG